MNKVTFKKVSIDELPALKSAYYAALAAPYDGMWGTFASQADHYLLADNQETKGFCCVNTDLKLLQFYSEPNYDASPAFAQAIKDLSLTGAFVSTIDPLAMALSMDHQTSMKVHALMYHYPKAAPPKTAVFPDGADVRLLSESHLDEAVAFAHETLGASEAWLSSYFSGLIGRQELYGVLLNGALIATGECRRNDNHTATSDVGIVVSKNHRGQGLASNVLRALVNESHHRGDHTICSTEADNLAAQKAISSAGFLCYHRIVEFTF